MTNGRRSTVHNRPSVEAAQGRLMYCEMRTYTLQVGKRKLVKGQIFRGKLEVHGGDALQPAGKILTSNKRPFDANVTRERQLITGQNPRSDRGIAETLIPALNERSRHTRRSMG